MANEYVDWLNVQLEELQRAWDEAAQDGDSDRMGFYSEKMDEIIARIQESD